MNSKYLIKNNKKTYENFYSSNNYVFSLPLLLNWAWDIYDNYKWISLKQKLPFRIYIWINKIREKKIKFWDIKYYDVNEKQFIKSNIYEYAPMYINIHNFISEKYKDNILKDWWLEFTILSETSRWLWLWYTSITSLLFFISMEKIYNNVNFYVNESIIINDFLNIDTDIDRLFRLSLEFRQKWYLDLSVENQISCLFDSSYPILSFKEDFWKDLNNISINDLKIFWYRLNNLEDNLSIIPFLPIDYWLIYSWRPVLIDHIKNTNDDSLIWTSELKNKLSNYFWDSIEKSFPVRKPLFYKTFVEEEWDVFKDTYWKLMWAISLEILNLMIKLYSKSYTESRLRNFINAINKLRYWNKISRKSSKTFWYFLDSMYKNFSSSARILWLCPNDTSIMWWSAIFAVPLEWFRKELLTSIEKTSVYIKWVKLIYANWLDGLEYKWFVVNQDISNWIYSDFVNKNSLVLTNLLWISKIIDYDYVNKNFIPWLTLDLINKKIYIDWEKLTSKDLHSQNTTIDILNILISNFWKDVSNKELPKSSYSNNKNEMLWKIVIPLIKLIELKKEQRINLICKWKLSDFYLKLKESNVEINMIRKLW